MSQLPIDAPDIPVTPLIPVSADGWADWIAARPDRERTWAQAAGFTGQAGTVCAIPDADGGLERVLAGIGDGGGSGALWDWAGLPGKLPVVTYRIEPEPDAAVAEAAALGWTLGTYRFDRYKSDGDPDKPHPALVWPAAADRAWVTALAQATTLVRNLVNTPAGDMGPDALGQAALDLAKTHGADCRIIVGDDLLAEGYPAVHAVGRAAAKAPRLIDLRWGHPAAPRVTLVGKGVCFDTGGLDIKPAAGMKLMKKDMGGAAHALGLAQVVMALGLPVRLRVLIPAVENAISGNALYPLDVVPTRRGKTIEIGHTDAEGRVILADALAEGSDENPEVLIDFATLTGAARVALGTELPALFSPDEALAADLLAAGTAADDAVWRLPLFEPYRRLVKGKSADLTNAPEGGFGGAITAALFLQAFVAPGVPWAHFDIMAWNTASRPGRPEGGEAMALRAAATCLRRRYGGGA